MFLTNPTVTELQTLELPVLLEMLTKQTADYIQFINDEGLTSRTISARDLLHNIQSAIEAKYKLSAQSAEKIDLIPAEGIRIPGAGHRRLPSL